MKTWDLTKLYKGFDDPAFASDIAALESMIEDMSGWDQLLTDYAKKKETLLAFLNKETELDLLVDRLMHYASLVASVESTNQVAMKSMNQIQMILVRLAKIETRFSKWLLDYPNLDNDVQSDAFLKEHAFHIHEIRRNARHLLDEKTEILLAKLRQTGSTAWSNLQSLLTSTLAVDYDGKEITLSEVRNLATSPDAAIRKRAYEAEIKAYEKIEKSIAYALNAIKGEVNVLSQERGFSSPLAQTLEKSRMTEATLKAMQDACLDYMDVFRAYFKRKAKVLGHENGLPFYDLFAPMGKADKTFTIPEAEKYIVKNFASFSEELASMAQKAFKDNWVDYTPRKGKVGGAFCANLSSIKESRVMTNFEGSFDDVMTLAHELGHAFHGESIFKESPLNGNYTMPVAETASIFCETIVMNAALNEVDSDAEKIFLLESSLQGSSQVVVDIMSRFLFERAVFEGRETTVFDESELKDLMLKAQEDTYGDGLDPKTRHPYMWICKPHYYSAGLSYYNFPYTYGLLFAKGLYAKYLEDKQAFVKVYDDLLRTTGKAMVEDVASKVGIDVTQKDFWLSSLAIIKKDIDLFLALTE